MKQELIIILMFLAGLIYAQKHQLITISDNQQVMSYAISK